MRLWALLVASPIIALGGGLFGPYIPQQPLEIRWLIAHQPAEVFDRAAESLAENFEQQTGRPVTLRLVYPEDVGETAQVPKGRVLELLKNGTVDMASVNVDSLISNEDDANAKLVRVLHLPYLFRDYASADRVFDGAPGARILKALSDMTDAHALGITYSGGFRVIATKKPIHSVSELAGQRITTWGDGVIQDNLRSAGAVPVRVALGEGAKQMDARASDGAEFTYTRAENAVGASARAILETNHVLFTSTILAGEPFYASLTPKERAALAEAATSAAQHERKDSIEYSLGIRADFARNGVSIIGLSDAARAAAEAWAAKQRERLLTRPEQKALVDSILEAQK